MYRVIVIVMGALALAGCSSSADWLNLDAFKPKPAVEAVRFESAPPGAQVTLPNGQTCMTPCASPLKSNGTYTVQFALIGYQPASATIAPLTMSDGTTQLRPNPVTVQLTPIAPPKRKVRPPPDHPEEGDQARAQAEAEAGGRRSGTDAGPLPLAAGAAAAAITPSA